MWILSTFYSVKADEVRWNENMFTEVIGKELTLDTQCTAKHNGRRYQADLCGSKTVWEVEWGNKDYEAIGQSLTYAHIFKKNPGIIFLVYKGSHMKRIKTALPVLKKHNIEVMIYEVNRETGSFRMVG